jgi:lysozyme family protein
MADVARKHHLDLQYPDSFRKALPKLLDVEGGYANLEADPRGATRWGIPADRARAHNYAGDMADLPLDKAAEIYMQDFWEPLRCTDISRQAPAVAFHLFEAAVHVGKSVATQWLQGGLNLLNRQESLWEDIATDGVMGPNTYSAVKSLAAKRPEARTSLVKHLICQKGRYYAEITRQSPEFEDFYHGWMNLRVPLPTE